MTTSQTSGLGFVCLLLVSRDCVVSMHLVPMHPCMDVRRKDHPVASKGKNGPTKLEVTGL
jgi:hypothetical protein